MGVTVFGIRHHGPGCARSLRAALGRMKPDIVLVEGPPDAQAVLPLLVAKGMKPPVALLVYSPDKPAQAVYYPFATFSPEWQAISYALGKKLPVRFMDLPQAFQLGKEPVEGDAAEETPEIETPTPQAAPSTQVGTALEVKPDAGEADPTPELDPLDMLARAAGYTDYERWWEIQIEQRRDINQLFEGILEAMSELRADPTPKDEREAQREAHMRQTIRAAQQEGFQRIAVICGAWHSPVLTEAFVQQKTDDEAILSKLKSVKVEATWIPWTNSRLSYRSGYGAGVNSPGWYEHIWTAPDKVTIRWSALAARLLRAEGLDASSASVIETVRLAEALAAIRDLPMPGLAELHEAILTVLCHGNTEPMNLIRQRLEIGERLGKVPPETPVVPVQQDLENKRRRLKPGHIIEGKKQPVRQNMAVSTEAVTIDLDLRERQDRECSRLLHQLLLLGLPWGKLQRGNRHQMGTYHEIWQVRWQVEFVVKLIEANVWGNTIERAASGYVCHQADKAEDLAGLTNLYKSVVLAELPDAVSHLLSCIQTQAAVAADVGQMMRALPPLLDQVTLDAGVRQTHPKLVWPIIYGLLERVLIGLPGACSSLDDDAARALLPAFQELDTHLHRPACQEQYAEWQGVLSRLAHSEGIHCIIRGYCCRALFDKKSIDGEELYRLARLALTPTAPLLQAAGWIEGVLSGGGNVLLHLKELWIALDLWLCDLAADSFVELLPLLRRAFSQFAGPERRAMGEKVRHLHREAGSLTGGAAVAAIDQARAASVLPVLAQLLGVKTDGN
jgi:hypothetical protein